MIWEERFWRPTLGYKELGFFVSVVLWLDKLLWIIRLSIWAMIDF